MASERERGGSGITSGGLFWTLLLVLFIGLKLTGFVDWSWFWVVSPLWAPLAIVGFLALLYGLVVVLEAVFTARTK